ncbi:MAG: DUF6339 family protein [Pseudomonadota bacterium]
MLLFPQLPRPIAKQLGIQTSSMSVKDLSLQAGADHAAAIFTPVGGARITSTSLNELRRAVVEIAGAFGYPNIPNGDNAAGFDAAASVALFKLVSISAAEASKPGVWDFLSCVLLPDVVRWRFHSAEAATSQARFIAGRRNTFQRLWWRAYHVTHGQVLTDAELGRLLLDMGEDELVQLMERPTLAGIYGLSAAVARGLLAAARQTSVPRRVLMREGQKRLLRLSSFVSLDAVSIDDANVIIGRIFSEVAAATTK